MTRILDIALQVDGAVAEGALGLLAGLLEQTVELALLHGQPHAAPATACRRLDHDREAHLGRAARDRVPQAQERGICCVDDHLAPA